MEEDIDRFAAEQRDGVRDAVSARGFKARSDEDFVEVDEEAVRAEYGLIGLAARPWAFDVLREVRGRR